MAKISEELFLEHVPSRRKAILDLMLGQKIREITKYIDSQDSDSEDSGSEDIDPENWDLKSMGARDYPHLMPEQYFSKLDGGYELLFENGLIVSFSCLEYLQSILISLIQNEDRTLVFNKKAIEIRMEELDVCEATDDFIIQVDDQRYSQKKYSQFIGKKITAIGVIKQYSKNGNYKLEPDERGIVLHFDDCEDLIFAFYLDNLSDGTAILTSNELDQKLLVGVKEFDYHDIEEWDPGTGEDPIEWDWNYWRSRALYDGIKLNIGTGGNQVED